MIASAYYKKSLRSKLFLLGFVLLLAVLKASWPEQTKPGAPADENTLAWIAGDPKLKRHPCESQKDYLQRKFFKGPENNYFVDEEE